MQTMLSNVLINSVIFAQADPLEVSEYFKRHVGHHMLEPADRVRSLTQAAYLNYRDFAGLGLSLIRYGDQVNIRCSEPREICRPGASNAPILGELEATPPHSGTPPDKRCKTSHYSVRT